MTKTQCKKCLICYEDKLNKILKRNFICDNCYKLEEKKYSIEDIKEYLTGSLFSPDNYCWNYALNNAIVDIEDPEDGIEAVLKRIELGWSKSLL
jgi:hypothetical protein